jgi:hypothetical protein
MRRLLSMMSLHLVLVGCADVARIAPSLTIEAVGSRRVSSTGSGDQEHWAWGASARLGGALEPAPLAITPERALARPPIPTSRTSACRIPTVCAWEARARAEALARARAIASEEPDR